VLGEMVRGLRVVPDRNRAADCPTRTAFSRGVLRRPGSWGEGMILEPLVPIRGWEKKAPCPGLVGLRFRSHWAYDLGDYKGKGRGVHVEYFRTCVSITSDPLSYMES
jgi:hypothetical protein